MSDLFVFQSFKDVVVYNAQSLKALLVEQLRLIEQVDCAASLFCASVGWSKAGNLQLEFRSKVEARSLLTQCDLIAQILKQENIDRIMLSYPDCTNPFCISASMAEDDSAPPNGLSSPGTIGSYGSSRLSSDPQINEIEDFIRGKKHQGLIVTITSMVSDRCLVVNELQALDRGGGWTTHDWIGTNFKELWRDSFLNGNQNYYGDLIETVQRDLWIPSFYYKIRRPSGALAEYASEYHYLPNFMGPPARLAISIPGEWRIVEASPDGSEAP